MFDNMNMTVLWSKPCYVFLSLAFSSSFLLLRLSLTFSFFPFLLVLPYSITFSIRQQLWLAECGLKSHLLLPLQTSHHTHTYACTHTDSFLFSVFSTVLAPGHGYCKMLFEWGTLWAAIVCQGSVMESIFSLSVLLGLVTGITYYRWLWLEFIHWLKQQDKRVKERLLTTSLVVGAFI